MVGALVQIGLVSVIVLVGLTIRYLLSPLSQVRGIPTVPFWVALLPLVKDVDQQDLFKRYIAAPLRRHGAVKIFFAAQWNVLVHKPEYMAQVFRQEDVYQKSGNYKKIPHSVLASFLGDNIISSRGETWRTYQQIIRPGLQTHPDLECLLRNARMLRNLLVEAQTLAMKKGVHVQESMQRYTIANFAQLIFNVDFHVRWPLDALHTRQLTQFCVCRPSSPKRHTCTRFSIVSRGKYSNPSL
jgi:cytochrome P450